MTRRPAKRKTTAKRAPSPYPIPKRGPHGAKVIGHVLTVETGESIERKMFAPRMPSPRVPVFNRRGDVVSERFMPDAEWNAAVARYERALAKHNSGPMWWRDSLAGHAPSIPDRVELRIVCEAGISARGFWAGNAWHWVEETWVSSAKETA